MKTTIIGKFLFDGTDGAPIQNPVITIENGRITSITNQMPNVQSPMSNPDVVDCSDLTLLPGLIDSHVHLCFAALDGHEETLNEICHAPDERILLRCVRNAQAALKAGITTVRDCGGRGYLTLRLRDAINDGLIVGPRVIASGMPITTTGGHLHFCGCEADTADEMRAAARRQLKDGVDFVKICATGGMMTPGANPNLCQYSTDEMRAAVVEAGRWHTHVGAHILAAEGIRRCLDAGVRTLEHCVWRAPNGPVEFDPRTAERMAGMDAYWGLTIAGISWRFLPDVNAPEYEGLSADERFNRLRVFYDPWREMYRLGVKAMLSSDAGVRWTPFDAFHRSLEGMVVGLEVSPRKAIIAATRAAAQGIGISDEVGTIEVGKRADIIAVAGNPLDDVRAMRNVRKVWRDGRLVFADGMVAIT
jgi:imidazolonepropionase-like amidohydrolase